MWIVWVSSFESEFDKLGKKVQMRYKFENPVQKHSSKTHIFKVETQNRYLSDENFVAIASLTRVQYKIQRY